VNGLGYAVADDAVNDAAETTASDDRLNLNCQTVRFLCCFMNVFVLQDGVLNLIVTHNGRVVRTLTVPSAGRLDDDRPHRVLIRRQNRRVGSSVVVR